MDDLVKRVTVIQRSGDKPQVATTYQRPQKKSRGKVPLWSRPFERAIRELAKAQVIFGQELLRRHEETIRRRRRRWMMDEPSNMREAGRAAYNEVRKAVPFKILPKA